MNTEPEQLQMTQTPSAEQLATARLAHWHQNGNAALSLEEVRNWLNRGGLVLFGARPQLGAPAPSFTESILGKKIDAPELAEIGEVKSLLARLVAEGAAVPLNLMGAAGGVGTDVPDFVVSAGVFSYIFTLRGNKAWKQPPSVSGAVKVSPLALAVYEMLAAKVTLSAYDLTTQLGGGVTEVAVLRALTELWGQLRVIPVAQADGANTLWELSTARFTKQIKSGANAGQPSALSALISLYMGQAIAATEDEVESFLSPLAPRSRVRDVLHALLSARQLESIVIDGKTLLHVTGELPGFAVVAKPVQQEAATGDGPRISKFTARPGSKLGTGLKSKPYGAKSFGAKPAFGDRERRPFKREDGATETPRFDKPWAEKRPPAPGDRPKFGSRFAGRQEGFAAGAEGRPPRREFAPRPEGEGPRKTFSKPGTFGRKREGSFGAGEGRPPRREAGGDRPGGTGFKRPGSYTPRPGGFQKPGYGAEAGEPSGGEAPKRVFRKFDAPRERKPFGARPGGDRPAKPYGDRPARTYGDKPSGGFADRPAKSFGDRPARPYGDRPARPFGDRPAKSFGDRPAKSFGDRPARPFGDRPDKPFGDRSARPARPQGDRPRTEGRPSFGDKPSFGARPGGSGGKPSFGKKPGGFAAKGGPFAKFADGKKPFRKPGPGKPKPSGGGYGPVKRKRPEA